MNIRKNFNYVFSILKSRNKLNNDFIFNKEFDVESNRNFNIEF